MVDRGGDPGLRLRNAAVRAFAVLQQYGFRLRDAHVDGTHGDSVVVASDTVAIVVRADWHERQLSVVIQMAGARPVPVERLLPHLRIARLPRNPGQGTLRRRLTPVAEALRSQTPHIVVGGDDAHRQVQQAGVYRAP